MMEAPKTMTIPAVPSSTLPLTGMAVQEILMRVTSSAPAPWTEVTGPLAAALNGKERGDQRQASSCRHGGFAPARDTVTAAAFVPSVSATRISSCDSEPMPVLVSSP